MRSCGRGYARACGAEDCRHCHPENFIRGRYVSNDPDEFELIDEGTLETCVKDPSGHLHRYDQEFAAEYRDAHSGALDLDRFVKEVVMDDYVDHLICAGA